MRNAHRTHRTKHTKAKRCKSTAHCLIDEFDPKYSAVPLDVEISHVDEYVKRKNHKNDQDHLSTQILFFKREFGALHSDDKNTSTATTATSTATTNTDTLNQNQNQNQNLVQSHTTVHHTSTLTQTHTQTPQRDNDDHKDEHLLHYREWMSTYYSRDAHARLASMMPIARMRNTQHRMPRVLRIRTLSDRESAHEPRVVNDAADDGNVDDNETYANYDHRDDGYRESPASNENVLHVHDRDHDDDAHDGPRMANANYQYESPFYNPFLRLTIAPHACVRMLDDGVCNTNTNDGDEHDGKQTQTEEAHSPIFPISFYEQNRSSNSTRNANTSVMTQTTQTDRDGDDDSHVRLHERDRLSELRRLEDHARMHGWHLHQDNSHSHSNSTHHRYNTRLQLRRRLWQEIEPQLHQLGLRQQQQHYNHNHNHNHNRHDGDGDRGDGGDQEDIVHDIHNYDLAHTHDMYRMLSAAAAVATSPSDIDHDLHLQHNIDLYSANVSRLASILSFTTARVTDDDRDQANAASTATSKNLKHAVSSGRFDGLHDFEAALQLIPLRLACFQPLQQTSIVAAVASPRRISKAASQKMEVDAAEEGEAVAMAMFSQLSSDVHLIILSMLTGLGYVRTLALWKSLRSPLTKFDISRLRNCTLFKSQALFVERYRQNLFDEKYKAQQAPALHRALAQQPRNLYDFQTERQSKILLKRQNSAP